VATVRTAVTTAPTGATTGRSSGGTTAAAEVRGLAAGCFADCARAAPACRQSAKARRIRSTAASTFSLELKAEMRT
jgi:hypothetical protein